MEMQMHSLPVGGTYWTVEIIVSLVNAINTIAASVFNMHYMEVTKEENAI